VSFQSGETRFFLEVDRGTEPTRRLGEKLSSYARIARMEGVPRLLLFTFPSDRREAEARRELHLPGLTVATSTRDRLAHDPLGEIWLPIGVDRRLSLEDDLGPGQSAPRVSMVDDDKRLPPWSSH
jgi:hypothetical protein